MKFSLHFILLAIGFANANFMIKPFAVKLQVSKGEFTGWVELAPNQDKRPVAVELSVYERILDMDGVEKDTLVPNKDFVVYPSEVLMYPGEKAKVQVVLNNKANISIDRSYTLLAKEVQLPLPEVDNPGNKVMVGITPLVNYHAVIALETGKPGGLNFVSSKSLDSGKVEVIVENKSAGRVPVDYLYLLVGSSKITDFSGKNNSIMPGQKRRFVFKYNKPPTAADVRFGTDALVK